MPVQIAFPKSIAIQSPGSTPPPPPPPFPEGGLKKKHPTLYSPTSFLLHAARKNSPDSAESPHSETSHLPPTAWRRLGVSAGIPGSAVPGPFKPPLPQARTDRRRCQLFAFCTCQMRTGLRPAGIETPKASPGGEAPPSQPARRVPREEQDAAPPGADVPAIRGLSAGVGSPRAQEAAADRPRAVCAAPIGELGRGRGGGPRTPQLVWEASGRGVPSSAACGADPRVLSGDPSLGPPLVPLARAAERGGGVAASHPPPRPSSPATRAVFPGVNYRARSRCSWARRWRLQIGTAPTVRAAAAQPAKPALRPRPRPAQREKDISRRGVLWKGDSVPPGHCPAPSSTLRMRVPFGSP